MSDNLLTVLVVEPAKPPYVKQIPDTLQAMQEIVGGNIDATYPFEDPVSRFLCTRCYFFGEFVDKTAKTSYNKRYQKNGIFLRRSTE